MSAVTIKELLEAGAHFGHQSHKWNPKMSKFIFEKRNGVHIINLEKTVGLIQEACAFITSIASSGKKIMFVGTKSQAKDSIVQIAQDLKMPFVSERWLGGMLTNLKTIRQSVNKLEKFLKMDEEGSWGELSKKEQSVLQKEKNKLLKYLGGVREMVDYCPEVIFIVDPKKENLAVREARKLRIPIIAILDSNCDPEDIDYCIPSNDDSIKTIQYVLGKIKEAYTQGREVWEKAEEFRKAQEAELKAKEEAKKKEQKKKADQMKKEKTDAEQAQKEKADAIIADLEEIEKQK
ncbi:MAG: 30S ribosomal protein S2 [uncultured bacterium]|nr:MAG: 30S ribosomal protein S2 [uncultured bacterium]